MTNDTSQDHADERMLIMAGSIRTGSLNQALARAIHRHLDAAGQSAALVDLANYPMPLYNGDLEASDGIPATTHALGERMTSAEMLVIVSPEYNGAFTPLLKNTIDWLTRIDSSILAHLTVLLASASPGKGGGARSLALVRQWLESMNITVAEQTLSVARAERGEDGELNSLESTRLNAFADQAMA